MEGDRLSVHCRERIGHVRIRERWSAGADAAVAIVSIDANGNFDTGTATGQIGVFVPSNGGLMAGAMVGGTK